MQVLGAKAEENVANQGVKMAFTLIRAAAESTLPILLLLGVVFMIWVLWNLHKAQKR